MSHNLENLENKIGLKGCTRSSLNAPGTGTPQSHPYWELGGLPMAWPECLASKPKSFGHYTVCTGHPEKVCIFCKAGPKQGQAEQLSKSRKKFLATTYKHFPGALYMSVHSTLADPYDHSAYEIHIETLGHPV